MCGGAELEVWDFRQRERVCKMKANANISHVKGDHTGLLVGVG
jgi:hypothetical protein